MATKSRGGRGGGTTRSSKSEPPIAVASTQLQGARGSATPAPNASRGGGNAGGRADRAAHSSDAVPSAKTVPAQHSDHDKTSVGKVTSNLDDRLQTASGIFVDSLISQKLADSDLIFLPFFPEDNGAEPAAIIDTAEVLKITERALDELLSMNLHRFVDSRPRVASCREKEMCGAHRRPKYPRTLSAPL